MTTTRAAGQGEAGSEEFLQQLYRGGELLAAGKVIEAKEHLERAYQLDPRNEKGQNLLGLTYFKLGLFERAAEIYEALVRENPVDPTLRVNLGLVYLKTNALQRAIREFEMAVDLAPDHKKAQNYLGLALAQAGEYGRARDHFVLAGSDAMAQKMERAITGEGATVAPSPAPMRAPKPASPPASGAATGDDWGAATQVSEERVGGWGAQFGGDEPPPVEEEPVQVEEVETQALPPPPPAVAAEEELRFAEDEGPSSAEVFGEAPSPGEFSSEGPLPEPMEELHVEPLGEPIGADAPAYEGEVAYPPPAAYADAQPPAEGGAEYEAGSPEEESGATAYPGGYDEGAAGYDEGAGGYGGGEAGCEPPAVMGEPGDSAHAGYEAAAEVEAAEASLETEPDALSAGERLEAVSQSMFPPLAEQAHEPEVASAGAEAITANRVEAPLSQMASASTLAELGAVADVIQGAEGPFQVDPAGAVIVVTGELLTRLTGVRLVSGAVQFEPELKRYRGRATDRPFGEGGERLFRATGHGALFVARGEARFSAMALGEESGYFREEAVFSFEEALMFENGRVPSEVGGGDLDLVHLRGTGRVLVRVDGGVRSRQVQPEQPVMVPMKYLVGWTGDLAPQVAALGVDESGQAVDLAVLLTGSGVVFFGVPLE
jgi:hypothetical protein